jgi:hypothetical protein
MKDVELKDTVTQVHQRLSQRIAKIGSKLCGDL